jgi:choice-of-anchor C domain-containing protein
MTKVCLISAVAVAAITSASAASAAIVVLDGDFNNTNPTYVDYKKGQSFGPWDVTKGTVDLVGGLWQSPSGPNVKQGGDNGSVDLDGISPGGISQALSGLVSGKSYTLTFDLSGNPSPGTKTVDVSVGSGSQDFSFTSSTNTHNNMMYVEESLTFVAGSSNTLSFVSLDPSPSSQGPVIGDVSIVSGTVPEASTWAMMLAGLAGLGLVGFRRSRQSNSLSL